MGTSGRIEDGGMGDPEIRDGGIDDPDMRDGGVDNPDMRDGGVDNPEIRDGGVDNPDLRAGVGNPDIAPATQPMSGGLPIVPIVVGIGVIVVAIAAYSILGSGGAPAGTSGASVPPGASAGPLASTGGGGGSATEKTANLTVTNGPQNANGTWVIDGNSADVSPTDQMIAGVWAKAISDAAAGYADIVTLTMGGTIVEGTRSTSEGGIVLVFSISRTDAEGTDLFLHLFTSKAGECEVTMARTATGVSGSFMCTGITNEAGDRADATGTFAT